MKTTEASILIQLINITSLVSSQFLLRLQKQISTKAQHERNLHLTFQVNRALNQCLSNKTTVLVYYHNLNFYYTFETLYFNVK